MRQAPSKDDEIRITNRTACNHLDYGDKADLIRKGFAGWDRQMRIFRNAEKKNGLEVYENKTKVMKVSRDGEERPTLSFQALKLRNNQN